ncbi:Crp/Fnr family transcriptional regulator [Flavobacterium sp. ST-75]|uniref:Crp/Fnr family transcriptional regulator n=1 Tax=Flavobacterium rhizophilum TaxID=3163296 RepID=A0ABW8YDV4_9FLAO
MDSLKKLQQTVFSLHQLPEADWDMFAQILTYKTYKKGDTLIKEGELEHYIYFLEKGTTRNYFLKEGKEFTVAFHFSGEFVTAFYSLITGAASIVTIELLEDAEVVVIPYRDLEMFYQKSFHGATVGRKMAEMQYAHRLEKEMELLSLTAEERYVRLMERNPELVAAISVKHLSSYLGIQPESLSRIRKQYARN